MSFVWIETTVVLAIHDAQLAEHGGLAGVRDAGLLESALTRPQNLLAYGAPDAADCAAAYGFGIARNHPFIDGNKRVAFAATDVFLRNNGRRLTQSADAVFARMMDMFDAGTFDIAHLEPWLRGIIARPE